MRRFSSFCYVPPSGPSLPGDIEGTETKVLVALEPGDQRPESPGSCLGGAGRKVRVSKLRGPTSRATPSPPAATPADLHQEPHSLGPPCGAQKGISPLTQAAVLPSPLGLCPSFRRQGQLCRGPSPASGCPSAEREEHSEPASRGCDLAQESRTSICSGGQDGNMGRWPGGWALLPGGGQQDAVGPPAPYCGSGPRPRTLQQA